MPTKEQIILPLVYDNRHVKAKQRATSFTKVSEDIAFDTINWSSEHAPIAGSVVLNDTVADIMATENNPLKGLIADNRNFNIQDKKPYFDCEYRLVRGEDNVVRLMAPIDSSPFMSSICRHDEFSELDGCDKLLYQYPFTDITVHHLHAIKDRHYDLGFVTSSSRESKLLFLKNMMKKSAMVEGILYMPAPPPSWCSIDYNGTVAGFVPVAGLRPKVGFIGGWSHLGQMVPCSKFSTQVNEVDNREVFMESMKRSFANVQDEAVVLGKINTVIPEAFVSDILWKETARLDAYTLGAEDKINIQGLMTEEIEALSRIRKAAPQHGSWWNWPENRDPQLAFDLIKIARALSVNTSRNLEMANNTVIALRQSPAPISLETRLENIGIEIPQLDVADLQHHM